MVNAMHEPLPWRTPDEADLIRLLIRDEGQAMRIAGRSGCWRKRGRSGTWPRSGPPSDTSLQAAPNGHRCPLRGVGREGDGLPLLPGQRPRKPLTVVSENPSRESGARDARYTPTADPRWRSCRRAPARDPWSVPVMNATWWRSRDPDGAVQHHVSTRYGEVKRGETPPRFFCVRITSVRRRVGGTRV